MFKIPNQIANPLDFNFLIAYKKFQNFSPNKIIFLNFSFFKRSKLRKIFSSFPKIYFNSPKNQKLKSKHVRIFRVKIQCRNRSHAPSRATAVAGIACVCSRRFFFFNTLSDVARHVSHTHWCVKNTCQDTLTCQADMADDVATWHCSMMMWHDDAAQTSDFMLTWHDDMAWHVLWWCVTFRHVSVDN